MCKSELLAAAKAVLLTKVVQPLTGAVLLTKVVPSPPGAVLLTKVVQPPPGAVRFTEAERSLEEAQLSEWVPRAVGPPAVGPPAVGPPAVVRAIRPIRIAEAPLGLAQFIAAARLSEAGLLFGVDL